jgi:hypothetical protein
LARVVFKSGINSTFVRLMKKGIAAISFLLYFAVTSGIVINSHYCMKRLVSIHLFETKAKVCGLCGMDVHDSDGCCRDEVKVIKLVQDQVKIPVTLYEIPSVEAIVPILTDYLLASLRKFDDQRHFNNHSPPLLSAQNTYLQINVFRI